MSASDESLGIISTAASGASKLYSFSFQYKDGSSYAGTVIDDGFFGYTVGEQIATPYGTYSINGIVGAGAGPIGGVSVSQYHDGFNGQDYTPALYVPGTYYGRGLGTEYDAVGSLGVFGHGGLDEILPSTTLRGPITQYGFSFTYNDGSSYSGTVYDNGFYGYFAGETIYTLNGAYKLTAPGNGPSEPFPSVGDVFIGSYYDSSNGKTYLPDFKGSTTAATRGLGQELDTTTGESGKLVFGESGFYEAAQHGTRVYDFTFTGKDGSSYDGTVVDDGRYGYAVGQTIAAPGGSYAITAIEASNPNLQHAVGTVYVLNYVEDGSSYRPIYTSQGRGDGAAGLGSERDFVDIQTNRLDFQAGRKAIGGAGTLSTPPDASPVAVADSYSIAAGTPLTIAASAGLLVNDTDADGDALTASLVAGPAHGTLALDANGAFTYTPVADYVGTDVFTYTASDASKQSPATTVSITVTAVDRAPVAVDDGFSTAHDVGILGSVLTNDTDPDGNTLVPELKTSVAHGSLDLRTDGTFVYTPDAGFVGADSFTYVASDGALKSNVAAVTINVVDGKPIALDDSFSVPHGQGLLGSVLTNDTDPDGDTLVPLLKTSVAHGSLDLRTDGTFVYTPDAGFAGKDSFTYVASDGALDSSIATVTFTVGTPLNTAPVAAAEGYAVGENTPLIVPALGILANDRDAEGDALTAVLSQGPSHGTLVLNPAGSFTYTPDAGYTGADSFAYKAGDGSTLSGEVPVSLIVLPGAWIGQNGGTPVQGRPYATQDVVYDQATGKLLSLTRTYADGTLALSLVRNADGTETGRSWTPSGEGRIVAFDENGVTKQAETFDPAGRKTQVAVFSSDGTRVFSTSDPATGALTDVKTQYADKSSVDEQLAIVGRSYTEQINSFDASGALTAKVRKYADGSVAYNQTIHADGSSEIHNYDTSGRETTSLIYASDRSRDVYQRTYNGNGATPSRVEKDHYGINNDKQSSDVTSASGAHKQTAFSAGVSLVSTPGVADTFTSSNAGGDTFVFQPGFGQDLITNFHSGSAPGHDVIQLDSTLVPDYLHLQSLLKPSQGDTLLEISPSDTIVLKGVTASSLSASNFAFVKHDAHFS